METDSIQTVAEQLFKCKQCVGNCSRCAKYNVIRAALADMSAVDQLAVDNAVYRMDVRNAWRIKYNIQQAKDDAKVHTFLCGLKAIVIIACAALIYIVCRSFI